MRKLTIIGAILVTGIFMAATSFAGGRLNFMLINQTGQDIVDAKICPTGFPQFESENLLKTPLDSNSRIYIGPNYYGEQTFWNIALKWANGHEQTFPKLRLTRYNTYTVYSTPHGLRMRQSFEPAIDKYEFGPDAPSYMGGEPDKTVRVSAPEKIAQPAKVAAIEPGKATEKAPAKNLSFAEDVAEKALALKATMERTRNGETSTVLPTADVQAGDKLRMLFSTNKNGHIYWVSKNSDGDYQVIFPTSQNGMDNAVVRNKEYSLPAVDADKLAQAGQTVMAVFSPKAIPALDQAVKFAHEGKSAEASKLIGDVISGHEAKRAEAGLIIEEEYGDDVDTQSQLADGETPFVGTYEINAK